MLNGTWDIVVENEHGHIAWEFYYLRYKELLHSQFFNLNISVFNIQRKKEVVMFDVGRFVHHHTIQIN
jgi:hypothetical protein